MMTLSCGSHGACAAASYFCVRKTNKHSIQVVSTEVLELESYIYSCLLVEFLELIYHPDSEFGL